MEFPKPLRIDGRIFFARHDLERYKARLIGLPDPTPREVIEFVAADQAARELGISRRTLARRIEKSED